MGENLSYKKCADVNPKSDEIMFTLFTTEQKKKLKEILRNKGLDYVLYPDPETAPRPEFVGLTTLYADPIILGKELVDRLIVATESVRSRIIDMLLDNKFNLTAHLNNRMRDFSSPILNVNIPEINNQLLDKLRRGMELPLVYDVILSSDRKGNIVPNIVEIQMTSSGYVGWFLELANSQRKVSPNLSYFHQSIGDPLGALRTLRKMTDNEQIFVIDYNPWETPTYYDQVIEAQTLGDSSSLPVSITDVFLEDDNTWMVYTRNKNGKIIEKKPIKHVLSRLLLYGLEKVFKNLSSTKRDTIIKFLTDQRINWLWHPAWNEIVNKMDIHMMHECDGSSEHAVRVYSEGDKVSGPNVIWVKKIYSYSGADVERIVLRSGDTYIVPPMHIAQKEIDYAKLKVPVRDPRSGRKTCALATLEIRIQPPLSYRTGRLSTVIMTRMGPRRCPKGHFVKTNLGEIAYAISNWADKLHVPFYRLIENTPFGIGVAFIRQHV